MNTELILKSDVLDILFENRNKLYGTYPLRKFYPERMKSALIMMLAFVIIFCGFTMLWKESNNKIDVMVYDDPALGNILPAKKEPETKPKKEVILKEKIRTQKWVSTLKMVKDSADRLRDNLDKVKIGNINIATGIDAGQIAITENTGPQGEMKTTPIPVADPAEPVENPEVEPFFPGGINALRTFLQRNLINPRDLENGEQVSVRVRYIVGYDGKLQRFETVKDGGPEFNEEVLRVLKKMPQWIAGKSNGKNVSVYYTIPVKFVSND